MSTSGDCAPIRWSGRVVALALGDLVYLLPPLNVLEPDHPHRRFVSMLALVVRQMRLGGEDDPEDDVLAGFYARAGLLPDEEFLRLDDGRPDAELAEHFNVPLEQVEQKRYDLAFLRPARPPKDQPPS
jgi:hypothetical protein